MKRKKKIKDMGFTTGNFASNPAYVEMVLGYLQLLMNGRELYYPANQNEFRTSKNIDKDIVNTRVTDLMFGLDLIQRAPSNTSNKQNHKGIDVTGKVILQAKGQRLANIINSSTKKVDFSYDDNPKEIKKCYENMQKCSNQLYKVMRDVFLTSHLFEVLCDYLDSNPNEWISEKDFKNNYWEEVNIAYGIPKAKVGGKKVKSASSGENNCTSLLQWLKFFGIYCSNINDKNTFMLSRDINDIVRRKLENNTKQIVFTGAPGTGKTFAVKKYVSENAKGRFKFIQFHSSYDYTDFVEGLRPAPDEKGRNVFVRMDGVFKEFCRRIVEENLCKINKDLGKSYSSIDECFSILVKKADGQEEKELRNYLDEPKNLPKYFFVIDEINRADLSRVFGELLVGLEEGYRGVEHRFDTQYSNLATYVLDNNSQKVQILKDDHFKNGFFIPRNLYLIGTMNDIDRSVDSMDFALRRRFEWVEVKANEVMKETLIRMEKTMGVVEIDDDNLAERIMAMNDILSTEDLGLSRDYHIGPAYFKDYDKENNNIDEIFNDKIKPLLREYMRGHDEKRISEIIKKCENTLKGK